MWTRGREGVKTTYFYSHPFWMALRGNCWPSIRFLIFLYKETSRYTDFKIAAKKIERMQHHCLKFCIAPPLAPARLTLNFGPGVFLT